MSQAHTYNPVAVPSLRLVPADPNPPSPQAPKPSGPPAQQAPRPASSQDASRRGDPQAHPSLERLLTLYLDPTLSLADIAFTLGLSIAETLLLTTEKDFKTLLTFYSDAHEQRAAFLARCNIDKATRTLIRLTESSDKPETARKAAGAIVRLQQESKPQKITPELSLKAATTLINYRPPPRDDPSMKVSRRTNNPPHRAAERASQ